MSIDRKADSAKRYKILRSPDSKKLRDALQGRRVFSSGYIQLYLATNLDISQVISLYLAIYLGTFLYDVFQYITNDKFNIIDTHNSKAKLLRFFDHSVHPHDSSQGGRDKNKNNKKYSRD